MPRITPSTPEPRARRTPEVPSRASPWPTAEAFLPKQRSLAAARVAAAHCEGCDLFKHATQTVFGEGPREAALMLVGETPGDREDLEGHPFVGPAGRLLDRALAEAGIDREAAYVTNVVKHFKWEPRGKRRLHKKPLPSEIGACMPWLRMEIELVAPRVLVCLGATAGQALLGRGFSVTRERGQFVASPLAKYVTATIHPSALLRVRGSAEREAAIERLVADLALAGRALRNSEQRTAAPSR